MIRVLAILCLVINTKVLGQDDSQYCNISPSHTLCQYKGIGAACGPPGRGVISNGISDADKDIIVDIHNQLRSRVALGLEQQGRPGPQKSAANMMQLTWDDELASIAQRWADQCSFGHDSERTVSRFAVGQNVHESALFNDKPFDYNAAIQSWYNEVRKVDKDLANFYRFDSGTGHYTQIVWGETSKIGCGATTYRKDSFFRKALVCNYGKAGNFIRTPMYKVGNPCSKCPSGSVCSTRYQGLCVFSGNQPLPIPNRPGVSPSLPSNNLPINPSTVQGSQGAFNPMFVEFVNPNVVSTQTQLQPINPGSQVFTFGSRPTQRPGFFRPQIPSQSRPPLNPFASFFNLFQG